jgi:hypothetical protein
VEVISDVERMDKIATNSSLIKDFHTFFLLFDNIKLYDKKNKIRKKDKIKKRENGKQKVYKIFIKYYFI